MPLLNCLLALLVVTIWGLNFIFVTFSLEEFSPLMLCALRFLLASVPAIFFIKPPVGVPFRLVVWYGLVAFAMQFGFLFMGMYAGMSPGMASILMQVQVFFSLIIAAFFLGERLTVWEVTGALVSFSGILIIGLHIDRSHSLLGFIFILAAAASWGSANLITKKIKNHSSHNMLSLVIWGSFVAFVPMMILSLLFEGVNSIQVTYQHLTWVGVSCLLYTVYASTLIGYGVWNWLLIRYPVGMVVPFTLLVPIVGIISSILVFGEPFEVWKCMAGILVISGLGINIFSLYLQNQRLEEAM